MLTSSLAIRSIVFDLDGTLYNSPPIAQEITQAAHALVAAARGVTEEEASGLLSGARRRLSETYDEEPTLTRALMEMGLEAKDFHQAIQKSVRPERYLENDPILYALLDSLRDHCDLSIYTNNNRPLASKILALLGVEDLFDRLYTIEYSWQPKPHLDTLQRILEDIGGPPESFLFVGDRQAVDLQPAASLGISTLLVNETGDLLQIHKLLGIVP